MPLPVPKDCFQPHAPGLPGHTLARRRKLLVPPARSAGRQRGKFLCRRRLVDRSFTWSAYLGYAVSH